MTGLERLRQLLASHQARHVPGPKVPTWQAYVDGTQLQVSVLPEPPQTRVRLEVSLPKWRSDLLIIAAEHALGTTPPLMSGDARFDASTCINDSDTHVLGCFDAPTRALVAEFTARGGFVSGGAMVYSAPIAAPDLGQTLTTMLAIAQRLQLSEVATNRALEDIARGDPNPKVRARYTRLGVLPETDGPGVDASDATFDYLSARLADVTLSQQMRLDAADQLIAAFPLSRLEVSLRAAPHELLAPIADRVCGAIETRPVRPDDDASAHFIVHFARQLSGDGPRLERLLRSFVQLAYAGLSPAPLYTGWLAGLVASDDDQILELSIRALCAFDSPQVFEILGRVQSRVMPLLPRLAHAHPEIKAAVLVHFFQRLNPLDLGQQVTYVRAIAATGDTSVEGQLVRLLDAPHDEVQVEVIKALGALGTMAIVASLEPYGRGWLRDADVKEATRLAITAIRGRANAIALPGALSIADNSAGGLSINDD